MKKVVLKTLFRLKTLLLLAVMFIVGGSAAWAENWQTVYSNALSNTDGLTIINNNEDQSTWQGASDDYVQYSYSGAWYKADDYMIFPAQSLEAGKTYRISFEYRTYVSWGPEKYAVLYGSNNTVEAMTNTIIAEKEVNVASYTTEKQTFTVPSSGNIYVSIVARSEYNMGYLYIKNYKLEVDADSGSGGGTVTPDPGTGGSSQGTVVTEFRDGYEYTLAAVGYDGTKYFWNVNATGTNTELVNAATGQGTKYKCEVHGDKIALKAPNGQYLRVKQYQDVTWLQNYSLTGLSDYSEEYSLLGVETYQEFSYSKYSYLSGVAIQGKRGTENGADRTSYFTVVYSNNGSSGWGFNNSGAKVFNATNSTLFELTEYAVETTETQYAIDITNAVGASVTICGETVTGDTYTATKTLQSSDVVVTGAPAGYKAEVTIENETITITWVEIPKTSITSYSDAPGTYSLDVKTDGFNNIKIYFADNFAENYNYQNLPQLLNWTLPVGAAAGSYPYANSGGNELTVTLNNANVAGDYRLTIPAGALSFEGGKTNPAIDLIWTLTAATHFRIGYYDYTATGKKSSEYAQKELTGFDITAPEGVTFASLSDDDCYLELLGTWDPIKEDYSSTLIFDAEWTLNDGVVSIRFAEAYTAEGDYRFRIPEGAIVATDTRTNKTFEVSAVVDPHEYFEFTFDEKEFEGTFNTFTLTLPEGITATSVGEFEASYWDNSASRTQRFTISDAEIIQEGRKLTVTFTAPAIPVDQNFSVILEEGCVKTADANQISTRCAAYNLYVRPVRMHFVKLAVNSETNYIERGAKIEEAGTLFVCFDEPIAEGDDQWLSASAAGATITDADGNDLGFTSGSFYCVNYGTNGNNAVLYAKLSQTISALGVYTFRLPADVYTSTNGHKNEAVEFTFEIGAMPLEITNVSLSGTEGGVAMPIYVYFNQKVAAAECSDGDVHIQHKTETGYEDVTLNDYGWTSISEYSSSGWYGDVTYNNYANINLYDSNGSYGSFYTLEAGDYRLVIDKDIFTSVKGTKLEEDYYYEFTVTAIPSATVAGALDGKYYGTYYASRNWIVPEGVTAYYVDAVNNGEIHLVKVADAGGVVNSNIGVLLESSEAIAKAPISYTSQYGDIWANDNMLRGTTSDQLITNDSWGTQYKYYMLSRKNGVVGFYWDPSTNDEGQTLNNKANKAYLRIPVGDASDSALRIVVDESELTGISTIEGEDSVNDIFDLQGKRVVAPKAGVYVKNGKKFIVK